jgi:ParB/RepB/Spo0J family partition protein
LESTEAGGELIHEIEIEKITPSPYQPRVHIDQAELEELAASIREVGVLAPVLVREQRGGGFELLAGERRWRGAMLAGLKTVPARILEVDNPTAALIGLVENVQRKNLTPWEEATGAAKIRVVLREAGWPSKIRNISSLVGWSIGKVSERLAIAENLTDEVLALAAVDVHDMNKLPKVALLHASYISSVVKRAEFLRRQLESENHISLSPKPKPVRGRPRAAWTLTRRASGLISFHLRRAPDTFSPEDAQAVLEKLIPIVEALRERAQSVGESEELSDDEALS